MARQLEGKVALVTGAASGIGHAVAQRFLAEGAQVVCFDRGEARLEGHGGWAFIAGDVRCADDNQRAVELALSRFGRLDILVANAGIYDNRRALREFTPAELAAGFDELFGVNVKGYLLGALAAAPALAR
ncbi:SDR family NAD(P)-dependent oxidoreductase [Ramlibacter sp. AW1]|uniref:SDR family NAD(P)-dependent oxidoreductase n=1 Tax=Ramlibacter aurantiacus TaxID=2801330 RepID=A0A936ZLF3_9BURK|nr:SDR family NAD(P)-dependent oxidoreductase [Ramlibacter aurantiacus]